MANWTIPPDSAGYSASPPDESVSVMTLSGLAKRRRDFIGADVLINATWTYGKGGFQEWMDFFKNTINNGRDSFVIRAILNTENLSAMTVRIVPNSMRTPRINGHMYVVSMQLRGVIAGDILWDDDMELLWDDDELIKWDDS